MKGLLIHRGKANLPEIYAYKKFFKNSDIPLTDIRIEYLKDYDIGNYNFIWMFMGLDTIKTKHMFKIHDYRSLSTPPFPKAKDFLKKIINPKPHIRVFLNNNIKEKFNFKDNVPSTTIDMGIDGKFFLQNSSNKEKDFKFIYTGEIVKNRGIDKLLYHFINSDLKHERFLLIGEYEINIYREFSKYNNIIFTGQVPHLDIPDLLTKAEYGINFIPYKYPYIFQTSTKLYEYCAVGLKIITTNNVVIQKFLDENNASFFILDKNLKNFNIAQIESFNYITPSMEEYSWENVIEKSDIVNILKKHLQ